MSKRFRYIKGLRDFNGCPIIFGMSVKSNLAERIKALRDGRGISQQKAADDLGISKSTYASYEKGNITVDVVVRLVEYFGVTFDEFFTGRQLEPSADIITPKEESLLRAYREADPQGKLDILFAALHAQAESRK